MRNLVGGKFCWEAIRFRRATHAGGIHAKHLAREGTNSAGILGFFLGIVVHAAGSIGVDSFFRRRRRGQLFDHGLLHFELDGADLGGLKNRILGGVKLAIQLVQRGQGGRGEGGHDHRRGLFGHCARGIV